jgi:hypothetical protein
MGSAHHKTSKNTLKTPHSLLLREVKGQYAQLHQWRSKNPDKAAAARRYEASLQKKMAGAFRLNDSESLALRRLVSEVREKISFANVGESKEILSQKGGGKIQVALEPRKALKRLEEYISKAQEILDADVVVYKYLLPASQRIWERRPASRCPHGAHARALEEIGDTIHLLNELRYTVKKARASPCRGAPKKDERWMAWYCEAIANFWVRHLASELKLNFTEEKLSAAAAFAQLVFYAAEAWDTNAMKILAPLIEKHMKTTRQRMKKSAK